MTWLTGTENDYSEILGWPDPKPSLRVSVVIPVYNRVDLLSRTVAGLVPQTYPADLLSVIVADDGSEEDVEAALSPFDGRLDLRLVRREHDGYGAGQARNLGASAAAGEILVFIDADCVPDRDLVASHARWHHKAENLVVIGSRHGIDTSGISPESLLEGSADLRRLAFGTPKPDDAAVRPTDYRGVLHRRTAGHRTGTEAFRSLVSSNFSVLADRFGESGGFSPDFHRWGGEDTELGWRLWNEGMFFVPDDWSIVYHQLQDDSLGEAGRLAALDLNAGLMASKIPHRFYRAEKHGPIFEVPKVSWIITPTVGKRVESLFDRLLRHRYQDTEVVFAGPEPETRLLAERYGGDPRFSIADDVASAIRLARGEYTALLHGSASVDPRLLSRVLHRLEPAPRVGRATVGYRIEEDPTPRPLRSRWEIARIDRAWGSDGLPVFSMARRREWVKALREAQDATAAWHLMRSRVRSVHLTDELVALPARRPEEAPEVDLAPFSSARSQLAFDLRGPATLRSVLAALTRFAFAKLTRRPYRRESPTVRPQEPTQPADPKTPPRRKPTQPKVRYIGWTGHQNMGDDALLLAVRDLFDWADVRTVGWGKLLLLGGGTLINRSDYLNSLIELDSPRFERAVFGTGVAHPEFWGQQEPAERWVEFLDSCAYVGVRGPVSRDLLASWGYGGVCEVVGDPALALEAPEDTPSRDRRRVVISPAWTSGELWGGKDEPVLDALAGLTKHLAERGRKVAFLSCHPGDDRHVFETMRAAGHPDLDYVAGYDDLDAARRLLSSAGLVVAERLHAAVLAAAAATPFVAVEYRPKVVDFALSVGQERFCLRSDTVSTEALVELCDTVDQEAEAVSEEIADKVSVYRQRLIDAAKSIAVHMA